MEINDGLENRVLTFVRENLLSRTEKVSTETTINHDIGIVGLEAYDFMNLFAEEFNVDLTNFDFDLYFDPEPNGLLLPISLLIELYHLVFTRRRKEKKSIPLKIEDLIKSAKKGEWVSRPPTSASE
ncbi:MAG TPA: hypothetical protein DEQ34_14380 [Balneolaceae bacterium]|nr:hypothetical protein [Balneolaceae bacterium]|tara:strand:- start:1525 stop:1902 length:378 start_codon:yes stop_codon:yes gene_type:complete